MFRMPVWKWLLLGCSAYLLAIFLFGAYIFIASEPFQSSGCWNGDEHRGKDTCVHM